ncbi:MAG TPA: hypothetical protein VGP17_07650 [Solirubrobacteraceae bacterium]|jgi:hypothetical protein|nr:hypothetical protein [Solirubrobacteraceae bacterium]
MPAPRTADPSTRRALLGALAIVLAVVLAGCGDAQPRRIGAAELAGAQTFPYYTLYWVGPSFEQHPITAADGVEAYKPNTGDSVYYGDCLPGNGALGSKGCLLPLKVTTSIYALHTNVELGSQRNTIIRGVPAAIFEEGRAIELYTSRLVIDLYASTPARAHAAAQLLRPLNTAGSSTVPLPAPVYCPQLSGHRSAAVYRLMQSLPGGACENEKVALAQQEALKR